MLSRGAPRRIIRTLLFLAAALILGIALVVFWGLWTPWTSRSQPFRFASTAAGLKGEFGEPFGIAVRAGDVYVSDGQNGTISLIEDGTVTVFAEGLDTPSGIAFDNNGNLLVADPGNNTIRSIDQTGAMSKVAGVEGHSGFTDGDASAALFNGPIGVAVGHDGKIFVADTYNDRIRVIENGKVSTFAGTSTGYADGIGSDARFDTPCGLAIWNDRLLVADAGNRRIRVVEPDGRVWTLAGTGKLQLKDGLLGSSSFVQPTAVAVDHLGSIIVADGNAIRQISGNVIPFVRTITDEDRGTRDGPLLKSRFNRPSGIAVDPSGDLLITDSDNRLVRRVSATRSGHEITAAEIDELRDKAEDFRLLQPPRWPYDPPDRPRDIAGTLGELRGDIPEQNDPARFHNGLDIAGAYGETARFVRSEKVLQPVAAAKFNTLRELLRMPSLGYIHVRLGRDSASTPFDDLRFQFQRDMNGQLIGVRVPRGTKFNAGEAVGTLNAMNHVHLIAGRSGFEINALDALILPGLTDTRPPVVESVQFIADDGSIIATKNAAGQIQLTGTTHIVMRAYDRMDGNGAGRRLGIYQAGYQLLWPDLKPLGEVQWTIKFDRMPPYDAPKFVYGNGSHSGAKGETIFNYIVTNRVQGDTATEDHLDISGLDTGIYVVRVIASDAMGNQSYIDTEVEIVK